MRTFLALQTLPRRLRLALTLLAAWLAALACQALRVPLPWMIGPLLLVALCSLAGLPVAASVRLRNVGLWVIGIGLGLYFTPAVVAMLPVVALATAAAVAWVLLQGYLFYRWLLRQPGVDPATAFFSAAIGGASEMSLLADRHGAQTDRVAAAHSMRVLLVVLLVPFAYQWLGVHGADPSALVLQAVRPQGLLGLALASALGVALMAWLGGPNPWVLGALGAVAALTASGLQLSALPQPASQAGQLFIGVALGARFTPGFARAAPRWLAAVVLGTLAMIVTSVLFAGALSWASGLHPATLLLGTAPGGIAEMCITAKVLQLGVPTVTVFQLARYVAVLTLTAPLFRLEQRRLARQGVNIDR